MEHLTSAPPDLAAALEIPSLLWYFSRGKRKMCLDAGEFLKSYTLLNSPTGGFKTHICLIFVCLYFDLIDIYCVRE